MRVRPSLFTRPGLLIDLFVDLLVKLKIVVSCSISELEKKLENQNSLKAYFSWGLFTLFLSQIRKNIY